MDNVTELDRFEEEQQTFFEKVRANYLERSQQESGRFKIVDASASLASVQKQISSIVISIL